MNPEDLQEMYDGQREFLLEMLVNDEVMLQKAAELGLTLTEEEKAQKMIAEQKKIAKLHGDLDDIIDALDISINQT